MFVFRSVTRKVLYRSKKITWIAYRKNHNLQVSKSFIAQAPGHIQSAKFITSRRGERTIKEMQIKISLTMTAAAADDSHQEMVVLATKKQEPVEAVLSSQMSQK